MHKKKKGFTLSEVLLVLSVIGVISALTIPTLIQKVSDDQYKTAWKKNFSVLNQAAMQIIANNGSLVSGTSAGLSAINSNTMKNELSKYISTLKTCNNGQSFGDCWHSSWGRLDGTTDTDGNFSGMIFSDGTLLITWIHDSCTWAIKAGVSNSCGWMKIDVNGFKSPNTIGKDIFLIGVFDDRILPFGSDLTGGSTTNGYSKAAEYLYQ